MRSSPIAPEILEAVMARLRAGSPFEQERTRLGIDADRLRRQLRSMFADYPDVMNGHKKHFKLAAAVPTPPAKPRQGPTRSAKHTGFVDTHHQARLQVQHESILQAEIARGRLRVMADFSADELEGLTAKIAGYVATGLGRRSVYVPRTTDEGS